MADGLSLRLAKSPMKVGTGPKEVSGHVGTFKPVMPGTQWTTLLGLQMVAALLFVHSLSSVSHSAIQALFIFYQPIYVMLAMLWLWVAVIHVFETRAVRYSVCFREDHRKQLLRANEITVLAFYLTLITSGNMACFVWASRGHLLLASYMPPLLYLTLPCIMLAPVDLCFKEQRLFYADTLRRVMLPFQVVHFTDFLLADILTSLAKPLSDLTLAICHLSSSRSLHTSLLKGFDEGVCSNHALTIPVVLCLPYLWRFVQCISIYRASGDVFQFFNAIKYCTAFPVIGLSYVKYYVPLATWRAVFKPLWAASAIVNTSYSFFWDVERDWEIKWFTEGGKDGLLPPLKPDVRLFKSSSPYYWLIASNLVLRISWTYKLSSHLRHLRWFVFIVSLLEVFRRFQWSFVRLEHELRKIQNQSPDLVPLIPGTPKRKSSLLAFDDPAGVNFDLRHR